MQEWLYSFDLLHKRRINLHKPLPIELIHSLRGINGFNEATFLAVHEEAMEPITSIRFNPAKKERVKVDSLKVDQLASGPVPCCRHGVYLKERPSFTMDPHFHAGTYYVQEASSMFLWQVLEQIAGTATSGLRILDLCAAPGGKSTLLASYFEDGLVVANDVIRSRSSILVENITKWGSDNVVVTNNDPKDFAKLSGFFDIIVVDAPCSGSGLFKKDNGAIEEWSVDAVKLCSHRQQRILADVFPALKKDGILIYATCSYSKAEDEAILDWLVEELPLSSIKVIANENIVEVCSDQHGAFGYRFFPDRIKGEGFFIAALRKTDGIEYAPIKHNISFASKEAITMARVWLNNNKPLSFLQQKENIIAVGEHWLQDIGLLQQNLYLRKAGICLGAIKGRDFIPNHELALSLLMNKEIAVVELNHSMAIDYLKKKEIFPETNQKGWALASFEGSHLGWMKLLQNRINNYYPIEWRILKQ